MAINIIQSIHGARLATPGSIVVTLSTCAAKGIERLVLSVVCHLSSSSAQKSPDLDVQASEQLISMHNKSVYISEKLISVCLESFGKVHYAY